MARVYNAGKTAYTDYDDKGNQTGAGVAGSENIATNGGIMQGSSRSLGGSSNSIASPYQSQLSALKKAQLTAATAGLDKQRNASLSNLSAEKATIAPQYQKAKTGAMVTAKQTARSFDDYMARRGTSNSGIAGQGTLLNNLGYQGAMSGLNESEANAFSDIARRETGVNNAYESDLVGASAGIEAQGLQAYINQMNQDRQFNQQDNQFNQNIGLQRDQFGYSQSRDAIGDTRYADETQYNRSQAELVRDFQERGFSADRSLKMAQLELQKQEMQSNNAYRNASLYASQSKANKPTAAEKKSSATADFQSWANSAMSQNMPEREAIAYAYANSDKLTGDSVNIDDAIKYIRNIYTQVRNPYRAQSGGYMPQ